MIDYFQANSHFQCCAKRGSEKSTQTVQDGWDLDVLQEKLRHHSPSVPAAILQSHQGMAPSSGSILWLHPPASSFLLILTLGQIFPDQQQVSQSKSCRSSEHQECSHSFLKEPDTRREEERCCMACSDGGVMKRFRGIKNQCFFLKTANFHSGALWKSRGAVVVSHSRAGAPRLCQGCFISVSHPAGDTEGSFLGHRELNSSCSLPCFPTGFTPLKGRGNLG